MNKRNTWIGATTSTLVLIAAICSGITYWIGAEVEIWYQDAIKNGALNNANMTLTSVEYRRGIFTSHAITQVKFAQIEGQPYAENPSFRIIHEIFHGPLPLAGLRVPGTPMHIGAGVVRTTLDTNSSAWTQKLAKTYAGKEPLVVMTAVGLDGRSTTHLTMPPLDLKNVGDMQTFDFSGLQGQFDIAPYSHNLEGSISTAHFGLTSVGEQFSIKDMRITFNQRKGGAFDLLMGESGIEIGALHLQDQTNTPFDMTGLHITGALSIEDVQRVAAEVHLQVDQLTTATRKGSGRLAFVLRHIDGAALAQLRIAQQKLAQLPNDPKATDELLLQFKKLLAGKPDLSIKTQGQLVDGDWNGQILLQFQDQDVQKIAENPLGFLNLLEKGKGALSLSKKLLETELNNAMEVQGVLLLDSFVTEGFMTLEKDRYQSTARFEGGKLFVNEKEVSLPAITSNSVEPEVQPEPDGTEQSGDTQ